MSSERATSPGLSTALRISAAVAIFAVAALVYAGALLTAFLSQINFAAAGAEPPEAMIGPLAIAAAASVAAGLGALLLRVRAVACVIVLAGAAGIAAIALFS